MLLSARHLVRAALPAFLRPLMRFPTFLRSVTCLTSYSGSTLPLGIASGLASLFNGLPSTPPSSVNHLVWTSYCSPLATLLFLYLVVFRRRAHGPFVHCLAVTVAVRTDHVPNVYIVALVRYLALISTSCHYGLGKPLFVLFTYANEYLSLRARYLRI